MLGRHGPGGSLVVGSHTAATVTARVLGCSLSAGERGCALVGPLGTADEVVVPSGRMGRLRCGGLTCLDCGCRVSLNFGLGQCLAVCCRMDFARVALCKSPPTVPAVNGRVGCHVEKVRTSAQSIAVARRSGQNDACPSAECCHKQAQATTAGCTCSAGQQARCCCAWEVAVAHRRLYPRSQACPDMDRHTLPASREVHHCVAVALDGADSPDPGSALDILSAVGFRHRTLQFPRAVQARLAQNASAVIRRGSVGAAAVVSVAQAAPVLKPSFGVLRAADC